MGDLAGAPGAFAPKGWLLVTSGGPGILWDVSHPTPRPAEIATLPSDHSSGGVNQYLFFPDGRTLASASDDGTVVLRDVTSPADPVVLAVLHLAIPGTRADLSQLDSNVEIAFSADGRALTATAGNTAVTRWDVASLPAVTRVFTVTSRDAIGSGAVAFAPGGDEVAGPPAAGDTLALWRFPSENKPPPVRASRS